MSTAQGPGRTPEEIITHLVETHQQALLRLCYAYLHDRSAAEDAVQEVFLKAYRSLGSYRGDASAGTWLTAIAINTCRDLRRSTWYRLTDRRVTPEMLPLPAQTASPEDHDLTTGIMNLPVHLREVVLLYYYQDMSVTEIAAVLRITHQAVSSRLQRARRLLKDSLERSMHID